jgi:polyhydroxybutyrate depolymerase
MRYREPRRAFRGAWIFAVPLLSACSFDTIFGTDGPASWQPGTSTHEIVVGSITRNYLLHVPALRPRRPSGTIRPYSLLLVLHGSSASAEDIRQSSQMDSLSEVYRFLVAYPNAVRGGGGLFPSDWNAGGCCGAASRENIDDVGFISALVGQISSTLTVDQRRIHIAGFSDGGRMAHHAACQLAPLIAAIGVVSGSLKDDHCAPTKPVAVIAVNGTSDDQVPYYDSAFTQPSKPVTGVGAQLPSSVQFWVAENGCTTGSFTPQSAHVFRTSFSPCVGAEVVFYSIEGGVHAWPGDPGGSGSEPPMSELRASSVIAQFFARQVRR